MPNIYTSTPTNNEYLGQLGGGDGLVAILIAINDKFTESSPWIEETATCTSSGTKGASFSMNHPF